MNAIILRIFRAMRRALLPARRVIAQLRGREAPFVIGRFNWQPLTEDQLLEIARERSRPERWALIELLPRDNP